jgi:hypothetical protein
MYTRNLVILANSIKFTGHCIAGKDLNTGDWVRLINNHPGPFSNTDLNRLYGDPEGPSLLSCIKISFQEKVPLYYQPENEVITGDPWKKIGDYLQKEVGLLEDTQVPCWLGDGAYGFPDRIPAAICNSTMPLSCSLHFTKLKQSGNSLTISYKQHETEYKPRLNFHFKGIYYNLGLTDIDYPRLANGDDTKPKPIQDSFVTLGVGQLFEPKNAFFKLVVGIIPSATGTQGNIAEHPATQSTNNSNCPIPVDASVTVSNPEQTELKGPKPLFNRVTTNHDKKLFFLLKDLRQLIADRAKVPPYFIFQEKSLREMVRSRPCDLESFCSIDGVGEKKLERYGIIFTSAIRKFCEENGIEIKRPDILDDSGTNNALDQIYHLEQEMANLNHKLKELNFRKNVLLDQAIEMGIKVQGNYVLQSSISNVRQLNLEAFKQQYPSIFMEIGTVRLSDAERLIGKTEVTELCSLQESIRYSVVKIKSNDEMQENPHE